MPGLKQLAQREELMSGGHRACAGCLPMTAMRQILLSAGKDTVCGCATGCVEVVTTIYPYTSWRTPFIHNAFENSAATVSGAEAAYRSLRKQGKIDKKINFIAMGGDGGTYDIGLQSLSGAMERGHNMLYVCYDNEAYMNTGIQRSSSTPVGTWTTTTPDERPETRPKKNIMEIMAAHRIPYAATATVAFPDDLLAKVETARSLTGTRFLHLLSACPPGWKMPSGEAIAAMRAAVESRVFPLYEIRDGLDFTITRFPDREVDPADYFGMQGRFRPLLADPAVLESVRAEVDRRWDWLMDRHRAAHPETAGAA